jgi:hypothetical protein
MWTKIRNAVTYLGFYMLYNLLTGKGAKTQEPVVGQVQAPIAEQGQQVPWIFGSPKKISAQSIVWYGDTGATPVKSKSGKKG